MVSFSVSLCVNHVVKASNQNFESVYVKLYVLSYVSIFRELFLVKLLGFPFLILLFPFFPPLLMTNIIFSIR